MLRQTLSFFIFCSLFWGCTPKSENNSTNDSDKYPSPYIPAAPVTYNADIYANQGVSFSLDATAAILTDPPAVTGSWVYSLPSAPGWMSIDPATGVITGVPTGQGVSDLTVKATDSLDALNVYSESRTIAVNGDPLRTYQWHLNNTGQNTFALSSGTAGKDIKAFAVYEAGIDGSGIKIAVSDSGGEINHDDLYENIIDGASRDYTLTAPYLGNPVASSGHGTAVSGIIAARGWNNIGVTGVAPKAGLAIFQFLESSQTTAILIDQASGNFDIFNYSYGDTLYFDTHSDADYLDQIRYQTENGRGGKGAFFVKAAGNEYLVYDDVNSPSVCSSHNANFPFENESPYMLVVGAVNADGQRASYSSTGSNIWVSAPGGEYGFNYPAMLTTDLPTCFKGFSKAQPYVYNDFEYGSSLNPLCNYTSVMNGTSSATPVVSGVIALILDANPNLTYRDVKHILAMSATQVDSVFANNGYGNDHPSVNESGCPSLNLAGHIYEQGWVTNDAGIKFSNAYGFGMVNVADAVAMAQDFSSDPMSWLPLPAKTELNPSFNIAGFSSGAISKSIPDASAVGVTDTITLSQTLNVETVQVKVQVTHTSSGDLGVELTSPSGTKSILMNINNSFLLGADANLDIVLTSHAFYGETVKGSSNTGQWTLKVIDGLGQDTGQLKRWDINILGH